MAVWGAPKGNHPSAAAAAWRGTPPLQVNGNSPRWFPPQGAEVLRRVRETSLGPFVPRNLGSRNVCARIEVEFVRGHRRPRRVSMRRFSFSLAAATALAGVSLFGGNTQAGVAADPSSIRAGADTLNVVQNVQVFYWHGRRYCWYDDAWNGPGWYWCGYAWRRGIGWGGAYGWHGWRGGHREFRREERRDYRRYDERERPRFEERERPRYERRDQRGSEQPRLERRDRRGSETMRPSGSGQGGAGPSPRSSGGGPEGSGPSGGAKGSGPREGGSGEKGGERQ